MIRTLLTAAALLALSACGVPVEYADCTLPAIGDPCQMPESRADAVAIIEAAAFCPDGEIDTSARASCQSPRFVGAYAVGEAGVDRFAHQIEDGSLVRCEAGRVTAVYRTMLGEIDGAPALFNVPSDDCDAACRARLALPSCRPS